MRNETKESLDGLKERMLEIADDLTVEEREEFYDEVNDWSYTRYEEALQEQEPGKKE